MPQPGAVLVGVISDSDDAKRDEMPVARTLEDVFDPRRNSLNAFRLLLAAIVIGSHSWLLSGAGAQPALGGIALGTWAVIGFFAVSGFLVTRSRLSGGSASAFYWNRGLRLLPGLLVCVLVIAFVLAPFSVLIDTESSYSLSSAISYVLTNAPLAPQAFSQKTIEHTLIGVPVTGYWNGPLWTLLWEGCCYVAVGVLASVFRGRHLTAAIIVAFIASTVLAAVIVLGIVDGGTRFGAAVLLIPAFFAGALAYMLRRRLDVSWGMTFVWFLVIAASAALGVAGAFAAFPLFLVMIRLSDALPLSFIDARHDVSYGLYIYGWPVQQLILLAAVPAGLPLPVFVIVSLLATVPFAVFSWVAIERPALGLKRRQLMQPVVG